MTTRTLKNMEAMFDRALNTHTAGVSCSTRGRKAGWYPAPKEAL